MENHWQTITPLAVLLYPASLIFRLVVGARRLLYRGGLLKATRLPVPVIVIGNISVGGTGKTPLVLWVAEFLASRGFRPGIVSRGYGRKSRHPEPVVPQSDPAAAGDEPVMLAGRCAAPVWVGADRVAASRALLAVHSGCDVIVCDDGLQHYRLARDLEVAVVDGERGFGNGWLLPAGPLREPLGRLASVNAIVVNGAGSRDIPVSGPERFTMTLRGDGFRNLLNADHWVAADYFVGKHVHAVAGIGNPGRFFRHLQALGVEFTAHSFPDHHAYRASDIVFPAAHEIVMTEKDAVKCRSFATEHWWALSVDAEIDSRFGELILRSIERRL